MRITWPRWVLSLAALCCALLVSAGAGAGPRIDLYTIGQGPQLFERWGHSLLCVSEEGAANEPATARCVDYGVAEASGAFDLVWGTLRGAPLFIPVQVEESVALDLFRNQGRSIERQRLPLEPAQAERLAARLTRDVTERQGYAYQPRFANCSTHPRDRLDEATGGALREVTHVPALTYREQLEAGLSGKLLHLLLLSVTVSADAERVPNAYEAMYLPEGLRDGVAERFGVQAEVLAERVDYVLPTSPALGRIVVLALGVALYFLARGAARGRRDWRLGVVAGVLTTFSLVVAVVALLTHWPELSQSRSVLLFWPTDAALPWLPGVWRARYAKLRLGVVAIAGLLEMVGVLHQPVLHVVWLIGAAMVGVLQGERHRAPSALPSAQPA